MATLASIDVRADQPERAVSLSAADVMTVTDVAEFLHIPVSTVYELARRGELPARRVGRTWRFLRPRLEEFLWS
jgi:excisionase family DNA binding protein